MATLINFLLTAFAWLVVASMLLIIGVGIAGVVFLAVVQ